MSVRLSRTYARTARAAAAWSALAVGALVEGCGACDDPTGCTTAPSLSYTGQFVEHTSGRPVSGVRVQLIRTSGVALPGDTITSVTDRDGFYRLATEVPTGGRITGDVLVTPPAPHRAYRVSGVTFDTRTVRGDGGVLGRWVVDPYVQFIGEIVSRTARDYVRSTAIVFRRTGGALLDAASVTATTDENGRFELRPRLLSFGDVSGTITVAAGPGLPRAVDIPVVLRPTYRDEPPTVAGSFVLGPSLRYVGEVFERVTNRRLAGVQVSFERTGGGATSPARVTAVTDAAGRFPIVLDAPDGFADVIGDFTFRVPGLAEPYVSRGVRLPVFDTDEVRLLQTFGVGPSLLYVGEVYNRGSQRRVAGARVEFRRTGGIAVESDVISSVSDANGRFPLVTRPLAESGELIGQLTISAPGLAPVTYADLRLRVAADDSVRLLRTFGIGEHLLYAGVLFVRGTGRAPAAGVEVEFRRTGGIPVEPDTFIVRSNEFGAFPLAPSTDQAGVVIGDLLIRPQLPLRSEIRRGVRLQTFDVDELRRLDNYGIGPSLEYFGEVVSSVDERPIVGARVEFRRTGGIAATPERITRESNEDGRVRINPLTTEYGDLVGDVTITLPGGRQYSFAGVRLPTFEADDFRLLQRWRVAP